MENFRWMDVYPSQQELLYEGNIKIPTNIVDGPYESVNHYLYTHFLLLREDFISCLREGMQNYFSNKPTKYVNVYMNVGLTPKKIRQNMYYQIDIEVPNCDTKKFMNGSLLVFGRQGYNQCILAKVMWKTSCNDVLIDFVNPMGVDEDIILSKWTVVESTTYFDPYFHVLSVIQDIPSNDFPMEKYIINVDANSVYMPKYLRRKTGLYQVGQYRFPPKFWPHITNNVTQLNEAQFEAFKAALSQEFVVIQGPPGTGKTFLGVRIAATLLSNAHFWYKNTPLLVIAQKNYSLDQFLEGLIGVTERIVRVGSQSKSEKLKKFNLMNSDDEIVKMQKKTSDFFLMKMKEALVIGMTTTIAARWKEHLLKLKCPIVIVEEAAEVLEAHVIAALNKHCQHLILIGDHQQLQPISANYVLGKKYNLGISLFERMARNGIQCYKLNVQHRMRPEISILLQSTIYPFLCDHESVKERPSIQGMDKNVFFITHSHKEEMCGISKSNTFEAEFIIALTRHLILNGYRLSEIAILATYAGQAKKIEDLAKKTFNKINTEDLKVFTLDSFQGQEADIILFSLVRSDAIGFLSIDNRICVALSRARNGFYLIGNMDLLSQQSRVSCF